jgi:type IV secretion system protein VirB2
MGKFYTFKINKNMYWCLTIAFCVAAIMVILPDFAAAATTSGDDTAIGDTLCRVVAQLTGKIGKGIATIAVIFLGIGLFLGKMSWGVAIATALGIGGIFGAQTIVSWLGGTAEAGEECSVSG